MFEGLTKLAKNTVEIAANVVDVPCQIVNDVIVEPVKEVTDELKEDMKENK